MLQDKKLLHGQIVAIVSLKSMMKIFQEAEEILQLDMFSQQMALQDNAI